MYIELIGFILAFISYLFRGVYYFYTYSKGLENLMKALDKIVKEDGDVLFLAFFPIPIYPFFSIKNKIVNIFTLLYYIGLLIMIYFEFVMRN